MGLEGTPYEQWRSPYRQDAPRHLEWKLLFAIVVTLLWLHLPPLPIPRGVAWQPSTDKIVYIIRHGEKIFEPNNESAFDYACLSEKGWARAYNLRSVFGPRPQPPFQTPDTLFAGDYANTVDCRDHNGWYRTQATIAPLAARGPSSLGLPILNRSGWGPGACAEPVDNCPHREPAEGGEAHGFGVCCNAAAATAIRERLREERVNVILVCWEHTNIPVLAEALGVPKAELAQGWPGVYPD